MQKIILQPGVIIEQSDLIGKVEDTGIANLRAFMKAVYNKPGVILHRAEDDMKAEYVSYSNNILTLHVHAGMAITEARNIIDLPDNPAVTFTVTQADTYYLYVKWVAAMDTPYKRYPLNAADIKIRQYDSVDWELATSHISDDNAVLLAVVVFDGSTFTVTDAREKAEFKKLTEAELTSIFDLIYNGYLGGDKVVVDSSNKNLVQATHVRITDISPVIIQGIDSTITMSRFMSSGFFDNRCKVTIKWGWEDVTGSGTNQYFDVTSTLDAASLTNHWLYLNGTNYRITNWDNSSKRMTLENADGTQADVTGQTASAGSPAIVHTNADEYLAMITPAVESGGVYLERISDRQVKVLDTGFPVKQEVGFEIKIGEKYYFSLISKRGVTKTLAVYMGGGSYTKNNAQHNYDSPFLAKLPNIDMSGADVVVSQAPGQIILAVQGMQDVFYEYGYTEAPTAVDFTNPNHHIAITPNRTIVIQIPKVTNTYNVAVRPILNGQVVGSAITKTVTAGGYIKKIYDVNVTDTEIYEHNSGIITVYFANATIHIGRTGSGSWNNNVFTFDSINDLMSNRYVGYYLNFDGQEYLITANDNKSVTTSGQGTGSGTGHIGVNANKYNVRLTRYKADGTTVAGVTQYSYYKHISTNEDVRELFLDPLIPNTKYGVEVIGETGEYHGDDWSDMVTFTPDCSALTMTSISVTPHYGGVDVSWQPVPNAAYYEGRYVIGNQGATLPDPQFSQPYNRIGPTEDTAVTVNIEPGKQVKVAMRCVSKCGIPSSNIEIGGAVAGGQRYVNDYGQWAVQNKVLTSGQTSEEDRLITKFPAQAKVKVVSLNVFVDTITLGSASYGKIRVYPENSPSSAGMITFTSAHEAKEQAVDIDIPYGTKVVVDGYDPSNPSTYPDSFKVDLTITYQLMDV